MSCMRMKAHVLLSAALLLCTLLAGCFEDAGPHSYRPVIGSLESWKPGYEWTYYSPDNDREYTLRFVTDRYRLAGGASGHMLMSWSWEEDGTTVEHLFDTEAFGARRLSEHWLDPVDWPCPRFPQEPCIEDSTSGPVFDVGAQNSVFESGRYTSPLLPLDSHAERPPIKTSHSYVVVDGHTLWYSSLTTIEGPLSYTPRFLGTPIPGDTQQETRIFVFDIIYDITDDAASNAHRQEVGGDGRDYWHPERKEFWSPILKAPLYVHTEQGWAPEAGHEFGSFFRGLPDIPENLYLRSFDYTPRSSPSDEEFMARWGR